MKTFIREQEGFKIYFEALEEYDFNMDLWDEDCKQETLTQLEHGELIVFCAKVTAEKNEHELAEDFLGMCIYKSEEDFYNTKDDYFDDMCRTVIAEAKKKKKKIQICLAEWVDDHYYISVNSGGMVFRIWEGNFILNKYWNMNKDEQLLLDLGFKKQDDPIAPYIMELGENIKLSLGTYPFNSTTLNMILPDGTIIVTKATEIDDIITLGKMFKECYIDLPY